MRGEPGAKGVQLFGAERGGVFPGREVAVADRLGVGAQASDGAGVQGGEGANEPRHPSGGDPEQVVPDQHLAVGGVTCTDAGCDP